MTANQATALLPPEQEELLEQLHLALRQRFSGEPCAGHTPEQLDDAEAQLGFALPPLVRQLYLRLDTRRFGFLPLLPEPEQAHRDPVLRPTTSVDFASMDEAPCLPPRLLVIEEGYGRHLAIDCADPALRVLVFEQGIASGPEATPAYPPFRLPALAEGDDVFCQAEDFAVLSPSLVEWLQASLAHAQHMRQVVRRWQEQTRK